MFEFISMKELNQICHFNPRNADKYGGLPIVLSRNFQEGSPSTNKTNYIILIER